MLSISRRLPSVPSSWQVCFLFSHVHQGTTRKTGQFLLSSLLILGVIPRAVCISTGVTHCLTFTSFVFTQSLSWLSAEVYVSAQLIWKHFFFSFHFPSEIINFENEVHILYFLAGSFYSALEYIHSLPVYLCFTFCNLERNLEQCPFLQVFSFKFLLRFGLILP